MTGLDFERKMNQTSSFEIQYVDERLIRYRWMDERDRQPRFREDITAGDVYHILAEKTKDSIPLFLFRSFAFLSDD